MGLRKSWAPIHATTLSSNHPDRSSREGDSAGGPHPDRTSETGWPTLVIEAGVSQSLQGLQTTIRWWFHASSHEVKIVLLLKIDRQRQQIILEKWTEGADIPRPGATTTRSATTISPIRRQEIIINISPAAAAAAPGDAIRADPESYTVTRGALSLEFELLFLRRPNTGEGDIIITEEMLRDLAALVWSL